MIKTGTYVQELIDEWDSLATARLPWEKYWRDIARYVLPQTEGFDTLISRSTGDAMGAVVGTPVASEKSKDLYDMTSLWAIERLTAGLLSLKTPETEFWHGNQIDAYFGEEATYQEDLALERLRNYQFKVRANPRSGFWPGHKSAVRSMCGFGDGWMFVEELQGKGPQTPYRYEYMPLSELYPGMSPEGLPNRMFRPFRRSAEQIVRKFGADNVSKTVLDHANRPGSRHDMITVLHGVKPRDDSERVFRDGSSKLGVYGAAFKSCYILPDDKHEIGESGFHEFPFIRYAWSNTGTRPYSEGPVAYAIGEIKSLQEMAKNELLSSATAMRPAYAVAGKNFTKMNLNPGATNPGLMTPDGKPLFASLNTGARPDFAAAVMEQRRNSVREMLYLNLWQIIIQDKNDTATAALIKAQEKGEMFGPVGISLNEGLSMMFEREVSILGRKGAFDDGSPLAMPDSMRDKNVTPQFSSPLDRLRRMSEMVGMQRLVEFAMLLAGGDPAQAAKIMARFDIDQMLDQAQEILGAPVKVLRDKDETNEDRAQGDQMQNAMAALMAMKGGGEAAKAIGEGGAAMAGGAEMVAGAPNLQNMLQNAPEIANAASAGAQAVPA